jgi:threonine synthase
MELYSTNNKNNIVTFKEAVFKGIADDGGLFMPLEFKKFDNNFFKNIRTLPFNELAFLISNHLLNDEIESNDLREIVEKAISFDSPLINLDESLAILELFHGPTFAFKDFGARFMANIMAYFNREEGKNIIILVATSGDTGSAVANGFYKVEGIKVVLLYPSKKVSKIQEQQLTTLDENIFALEVEGNFDDCQRLVKSAFLDKELAHKMTLSSANSINIARLLPQSFYYFRAYAQVKNKSNQTIISVPSGNFGNLTAGLFAKEMGLPVDKFVAATNANNIFPKYIQTGIFEAKPSVKTLSNAMDVGNPSNFVRIKALYNNNFEKIKNLIYSESFSDKLTVQAIDEVYKKYNYIIDPHGAVGYLALKSYTEKNNLKHSNQIVLETAHPAKFSDIVNPIIGKEIELPKPLIECMKKQKHSVKISKEYEELKNYLIKFQ